MWSTTSNEGNCVVTFLTAEVAKIKNGKGTDNLSNESLKSPCLLYRIM